MPATPIATSVVPWRHARPNESVTITAGRDAEAAAERLVQAPAADASGSTRQQHDPVVAGRVGAVDARARTDEAVTCLRDDEVVAPAANSGGLRQHRLHVLLARARAPPCPSAFDTTFCATTTTSPASQAACPLDRVAEQAGQIVAFGDLGNPGQRDDADLGQLSPSRRRRERATLW